LRSEVEALRKSLDDLNRVIVRQVAEKVDEKVAEVAVPREELQQRLRASGKRTVAGLLLVLVLLVAGVGANRLTLLQAQRQSVRDLRTLVQTCRTLTPRISPADLRYCESRVPGFAAARAQARAAAETARRNQQRLDRLEAEVANLKE
jgi:hypothetical protein